MMRYTKPYRLHDEYIEYKCFSNCFNINEEFIKCNNLYTIFLYTYGKFNTIY